MKPLDPKKIEAIYDATIEIVSTDGLAGLTMAGISSTTNLGMGTIYNYFASKEELINQLFVSLLKKHSAEIYHGIDLKLPVMQNFKSMFMSYYMDRWENAKQHNFIDQCKVSPFLSEESQRQEEVTYEKAIELLEKGKNELILKYIDSKLMLSFVIGGVKEIVTQMKAYDLPYDEGTAAITFELCYDTIKK